MQRVGRINRVGTEFDRIYVFNFFPTAQSHAQIPMEDRILEKLQAFHDTLGEDIKYLSDEEEVSAKKLFEDLNKDLDADEEVGLGDSALIEAHDGYSFDEDDGRMSQADIVALYRS